MPSTPQAHRATARRNLTALRRAFDDARLALALRCSVDGRLQGAKLDREQVPSFELAWAAADLLAAETALAGEAQSDGDAGLALLFAAEAGAAVLARLETLFLELGLDACPACRARRCRLGDPVPVRGGAQALEEPGRRCSRRRATSAGCRSTSRMRWPRNRSAASPRKWSRRRPRRSTGRTSPCPNRCCSRCARWGCSAFRCPSSTVAAPRTTARTRC